jgi:hypothetical protein
MGGLRLSRPLVTIIAVAGLGVSSGCDRAKEVFGKSVGETASTASSSSSELGPAQLTPEAGPIQTTGIDECDSYLTHYQKCVPGIPESSIEKMHQSYRGANRNPKARRLTARSCADAEKRLRRECP